MDSITPSNPIVKPIKTTSKMPMMVVGVIIILVAGLAVGFFVSKNKSSSGPNGTKSSLVSVSTTEAGIKDVSKYKDGPVGVLQKGGIEGEGTYHMDQPGGPSHTVYLNSTTVNMGDFVGKKVQVWGDTIAGKSAGWLMDVVKIKEVQ